MQICTFDQSSDIFLQKEDVMSDHISKDIEGMPPARQPAFDVDVRAYAHSNSMENEWKSRYHK